MKIQHNILFWIMAATLVVTKFVALCERLINNLLGWVLVAASFHYAEYIGLFVVFTGYMGPYFLKSVPSFNRCYYTSMGLFIFMIQFVICYCAFAATYRVTKEAFFL